jgi:hypothetical protein
MSNRARRIGVGSSGAARDDVEHQSQHRHSDGDCSNRQQDFDGRVRPFHGTRQGIEIAHRPIVDPPGQPPVLQLLAARSWEFLSPPNCARGGIRTCSAAWSHCAHWQCVCVPSPSTGSAHRKCGNAIGRVRRCTDATRSFSGRLWDGAFANQPDERRSADGAPQCVGTKRRGTDGSW